LLLLEFDKGEKVKHLSPEAVRALIAATDGERNKLLLTLTYEHGLRISEALSITKSHVRRGYLSIKGRKKGKRADEKLSPSTLALFEKVSANKLPHTLLFPFSRQWSSTLFHRACEKAGITLQLRQGIHSLRHSLGHHLLDAGASLPVVQKALRHRSLSSTGVYLEADAANVDQWRAKVLTGTAAAPAAPLSLAAIRAEMERLAALAASMQGAQADAPQPASRAASEPDESRSEKVRLALSSH
jgi:integrase